MTGPASPPDPLEPNAARFEGFAELYDAARPRTPEALLDILASLCGAERPALVVDLGCGTGLSTRVWAERAEKVVGVDPSDDMRARAESAATPSNVEFRRGFAHETGLPDRCADIVTCSQSLHWMDPDRTFEEVARIARSGGVFCAYDYDPVPAIPSCWRAEAAYEEFVRRIGEMDDRERPRAGVRRWEKSGHLERMRQSGRFRYTRELLLHGRETGDADRLVRFALSHGGLQQLLKAGVTEDQLGIEEFRASLRNIMGTEPAPWYWSYRPRIGIV
jgi:ubiquinone/menaquinone biosynthesis C-methylase UbiE